MVVFKGGKQGFKGKLLNPAARFGVENIVKKKQQGVIVLAAT
jgi:hypothetical protein